MGLKIWQRYITSQFLKFLAFFLFGFYFLYVVIDYSTHMQDFLQGNSLSYGKIALYYVFQFFKRADILIPLAILLGTIKVLTGLNTHRELVAFQTAGIKIKKLITPFLTVALFATFTNLAIMEFAVPRSLNYIDRFYDAHLRHSFRGNRQEPLHVMHLDDHSKLIYQYYDSSKNAFFDVIWLASPDNVWRMKYLQADPENPVGQFVDHLKRMPDGIFEKTESFQTHFLKDLSWAKDIPRKGYIPFENRSISGLWHLLKTDPKLSTTEKSEVKTQLLFKLAIPFLGLLVVFAAAPYCVRYAKTVPHFFIYGFSLFSFVAIIAMLDAAVILGENASASPVVAILSPFIILLAIFSWKFRSI